MRQKLRGYWAGNGHHFPVVWGELETSSSLRTESGVTGYGKSNVEAVLQECNSKVRSIKRIAAELSVILEDLSLLAARITELGTPSADSKT